MDNSRPRTELESSSTILSIRSISALVLSHSCSCPLPSLGCTTDWLWTVSAMLPWCWWWTPSCDQVGGKGVTSWNLFLNLKTSLASSWVGVNFFSFCCWTPWLSCRQRRCWLHHGSLDDPFGGYITSAMLLLQQLARLISLP